jgi:CheY-like chemotaxis protein
MKITEAAFAREGVLGPSGLAGCKFLVIDDSRMIRLTISKHLRQIGFESIDEADNGAAAIDLLRTGKDYDLVLLDLEMPGMNGFEFLKIVKSDPALRSVPVIVVSASEQLSAAIQCISDGAEDFLNKPFDPVLLRARVFSSIEKKAPPRHRPPTPPRAGNRKIPPRPRKGKIRATPAQCAPPSHRRAPQER